MTSACWRAAEDEVAFDCGPPPFLLDHFTLRLDDADPRRTRCRLLAPRTGGWHAPALERPLRAHEFEYLAVARLHRAAVDRHLFALRAARARTNRCRTPGTSSRRRPPDPARRSTSSAGTPGRGTPDSGGGCAPARSVGPRRGPSHLVGERTAGRPRSRGPAQPDRSRANLRGSRWWRCCGFRSTRVRRSRRVRSASRRRGRNAAPSAHARRAPRSSARRTASSSRPAPHARAPARAPCAPGAGLVACLAKTAAERAVWDASHDLARRRFLPKQRSASSKAGRWPPPRTRNARKLVAPTSRGWS